MRRPNHIIAASLLCWPLASPTLALARQTDAAKTQTRPAAAKDKPKPARPVEIENVVNDARAARAEFAADALIRLAESGLVADRAWKVEMLEEAFRTAAGASQPVRLYSVDGEVDTRPGYLARALEMQMDGLSLKVRAVRAVLGIDRRRARELFAELPPRLALPRLACEDALVPDVSEFYSTLARVALEAFTPAEKKRDEDVRFVEVYAGRMDSPAEVRPLAETIAAVGDTPTRLETLTRAFAKSLRNIDADDRTFTASLYNSVGGVYTLVEKSKAQGVPTDVLVSSVRDYFTRHLTAERCADNVRRGAPSPRIFKGLDGLLNQSAASANDPPAVSFAELKPAGVGGEMKVFRHWQTPEGRRLLFKIKELSFGPGANGPALNEAQRKTPEWEARLLEFRNELADWDERGEATAEDHFHQKCVLYFGLLELVPAGPAREQVFADYLAFLRRPGVEQDSPLEWFMHVRDLLDQTRNPSDLPLRPKLLDALDSSGDPALRLYAELERLFPPQTPAQPKLVNGATKPTP